MFVFFDAFPKPKLHHLSVIELKWSIYLIWPGIYLNQIWRNLGTSRKMLKCRVMNCYLPQVQFAQTRCAKYSLLFNKWRQFDEHAPDEFRIKVMLLTKIEDPFSFFRALLPTLTILQKTSAALQGLPWTLRISARFFDSFISKYLEKYFACFKSYFSDMVRGATDVNRNHQNHLDLEKSSLLFK